jgi:hypothetical protein
MTIQRLQPRLAPLQPGSLGMAAIAQIGRSGKAAVHGHVRSWRIVLKNSVLKPTVIADSFRPVGAGDRIDDGSAAG